jgi:hypothetical protein
LRIFQELYEFEPRFIDICPAKFTNDYTETSPVLIKCCQVKDYERRGNLFMVPWGVTYNDLEVVLTKITDADENRDVG